MSNVISPLPPYKIATFIMCVLVLRGAAVYDIPFLITTLIGSVSLIITIRLYVRCAYILKRNTKPKLKLDHHVSVVVVPLLYASSILYTDNLLSIIPTAFAIVGIIKVLQKHKVERPTMFENDDIIALKSWTIITYVSVVIHYLVLFTI